MSPTQGLTMRTKSECPFVDEIIMNHQMYSSEDSTVSADMLHTHQNYMVQTTNLRLQNHHKVRISDGFF